MKQMKQFNDMQKEFEKRITHCPGCKGENILYEYNELPEDGKKQIDEIKESHPDWIICPITGYCPRCKKYSSASVEVINPKNN